MYLKGELFSEQGKCWKVSDRGFRWRPVMISVHQGSVLGPILFNIIISDIDDDTKLRGTVDTAEERDAIQRDPDKLKRWALVNLMRFNKAKVLLLGQGNPKYVYKVGKELLESSSAEKDLGSRLMNNIT